MCTDPQRRTAAGVPDTIEFTTKPHLALQMIGAALRSGVPAGWVAADEVYGADPQLRAGLEAHGLGHVSAPPGNPPNPSTPPEQPEPGPRSG
ncbi:hypothetical protein Raf01_52730 [Rugosimonospora africana]|uniref:Transposase IS701-like DDE domain-containing protein n=1 Tax=Rugosimonospora africana TaxID=556532 RepID=A0A8J3QV78_9ACTN|nr:hypothetical protein Raf01_52730 [Rugosimonospora africana]